MLTLLKFKADNSTDSEGDHTLSISTPKSTFNVSAASKFVPRFEEKDLDRYFVAFEKLQL